MGNQFKLLNMKIFALSALIVLSSALNLREDGGDAGDDWEDPCDPFYPDCDYPVDPCEDEVTDAAWDACIQSDKGAQFEADIEACVDTMTDEEWNALVQCFEDNPVDF